MVAVDANAHELQHIDAYQSASNLVTMQLVIGDRVWVETLSWDNSGGHLRHDFGTFAGWLV